MTKKWESKLTTGLDGTMTRGKLCFMIFLDMHTSHFQLQKYTHDALLMSDFSHLSLVICTSTMKLESD